jgi:prolyl 4-hydroxylase
MLYLLEEANANDFQTNFPRLHQPKDQRWCNYLECEQESQAEGVTFKAIEGNAIFWLNFDSEGRGYKEVIHAGMPVKQGTKIGLNIWSWYQRGHMAPS